MPGPSRIGGHPLLGPGGAPVPLTFTFEGRTIEAWQGDTVAGALWAVGVVALGAIPGGAPRGMACGIGHCFACRVTVDGNPGVRACLVPVRSGMRVEHDRDDGGERTAQEHRERRRAD
jgi:sarcosine oxidase subunit alpha